MFDTPNQGSARILRLLFFSLTREIQRPRFSPLDHLLIFGSTLIYTSEGSFSTRDLISTYTERASLTLTLYTSDT